VPSAAATQAAANAQKEAEKREEERRQQERKRQDTREQAERREKVEKMKCHLHKKVKDSCKFCKKYKELLDEIENQFNSQKSQAQGSDKGKRKLDRAISEERDGRSGPLELVNGKTFGFSGLLQTHIVECAHFKSLLTLETFEQLVDETYQFASSVEPYMANSGTLPTALFCCIYRFFTLGIESRQLRRLVDSAESPYLRCAGFLYVRYGLPPDQLWDWLGDYILDDEVFKPSADSENQTTVGDYVESILAHDKYFNTVFPRLPNGIKRKLEEKLAPVGQYRKRTKANKEIVDVYREPGTKIEACIDGDWLKATTIELDDGQPTRIKVQVRLEDGVEETVHLGMLILADDEKRSTRKRGRSRSRSPGGSRMDWSRYKGRTDKELVDELRSRDREKAVCSTGKDYARKPVGYKAACALPREQGTASYRLMEEETFVPMNRASTRGRSPSPQRENFGKRPSAEHQARMQQLFEKYGNVKSAEASRAQQGTDVDRPDVMRLG
jgi:pre-mRNA-splicing factor 38B